MVPLALLAACNSDEELAVADRAGSEQIVLSAGIAEGNLQIVTRGSSATDTYQALTKDTKITLQVSGTWTDHDPSAVVKTTIATAASPAATTNDLTTAPVLYWDDFGSADTDNAETGRKEGLTIYGVAVDGQTTALSVSNWSALSWDVNSDQTTGWTTKDLLISNNVKAENTYKFDNHNAGKQLDFRHALSKITVNLKAGDGFANSKFVSAPTVTLLDWAHTDGTVNVTTGDVTLGSATGVTMYQAATAATGYNVTKEALVMPRSAVKKDADIIKLNADGNIYYVSSEKIRTAINSAAHDTDDLTEAGKNYIINVVVNKTDIIVTATVLDWKNVDSEEVYPEINIRADFGDNSLATYGDDAFSFYRSTSLDNGYSNDASLIKNIFYEEESVIAKNDKGEWTMSPQLYWTNHNTHYQFRGVLPRTTTETNNTSAPRVETATHNSKEYQVIKVKNTAYEAGTFPSDLQIARPEIAENETCTNNEPGHTKTLLYNGGICATEGHINLNFCYMMTKVEVNLSTSTGTNSVDLDQAKVEIVNIYNTGDVKLGDRVVFTTGSLTSYELNAVSGTGNENKRLSAVVPQALTNTIDNVTTNVRFRITLKNDDVYYANVKPIKKSGTDTLIAPNGAWEAGMYYVYNLTITKTDINITATLGNWTKVIASESVWF